MKIKIHKDKLKEKFNRVNVIELINKRLQN